MKLHYKGKYNLDPNSLPNEEHRPGAQKFKEAKDTKTLAVIANGIALLLAVILLVALAIVRGSASLLFALPGALASLLFLFPHEILHAICFKEDVYLYTNFRQGLLFVFGAEDMSKKRFIFMSLLPNLILGLLPYTLAMIFEPLAFLGAFGAIMLSSGAGDYYNVFNALRQVPKGALIYMYGINSYWYMPEK